MALRRLAPALALLAASLAAGALVAACGRSAPKGRFVGRAPPPFASEQATWLNSPPLAWSDLRGKVVLVELGFLH